MRIIVAVKVEYSRSLVFHRISKMNCWGHKVSNLHLLSLHFSQTPPEVSSWAYTIPNWYSFAQYVSDECNNRTYGNFCSLFLYLGSADMFFKNQNKISVTAIDFYGDVDLFSIVLRINEITCLSGKTWVKLLRALFSTGSGLWPLSLPGLHSLVVARILSQFRENHHPQYRTTLYIWSNFSSFTLPQVISDPLACLQQESIRITNRDEQT